jgi:hypothetical protein
MANDLSKEGSIAFLLKHEHPDWATNDRAYKFGPFDQVLVGIVAFKNADRTLEIRVAFPDFFHTFRGPIPPLSDDGLRVMVSWKDKKEITLWMNGAKVQSAPFSPTKH